MMPRLNVLAAVCTIVLTGCTSPAQDALEISHVHGIAHVDGTLYLATHHGLAVGTQSGKSWTWAYAGSERSDFMGFTTSNGTFYSSGHPEDPRAYGGTMLGLRRSSDQGQTWEQRSLKGEVDFHALTALPQAGHLLGWWRGELMTSTDGGATWTISPGPTGTVYALAASNGTIWAGTSTGLQRSVDGGQTWAGSSLTAPVASVTVSEDGMTVLASQLTLQGGATWMSWDGAATMQVLSGHAILKHIGAPVVFAIDRDDSKHSFASDAGGTVIETRDGGETWKTIRG